MISGKSFRSLLILTLFSLAPASVFAEAAVTLDKILQPAEQPQTIRYQEQKTLGILEQTLTSRGVLRFTPPDTLVREIEGSPLMSYRIQGSQLSIHKDDQLVRQLDLDASPELAGFALTLRALLNADFHSLQQQYQFSVSGTQTAWVLQLTPSGDLLSRVIERISITGGNHRIHSIDTYERGGNYSHMTLLPQ